MKTEPGRSIRSLDALILAGGRGSRFGGLDKASLQWNGDTFLDRALAAVDDATKIVVVGRPRDALPQNVVGVIEDPPGGGPVAGLAAGLEEVSCDLVMVLAVDYPLVDPRVVSELVAGAGDEDGCMLVDGDDRDQPLAACYRVAKLRAALEALASVRGASVREALQPLRVNRLKRVPAAIDCDSDSDLRRLKALVTNA